MIPLRRCPTAFSSQPGFVHKELPPTRGEIAEPALVQRTSPQGPTQHRQPWRTYTQPEHRRKTNQQSPCAQNQAHTCTHTRLPALSLMRAFPFVLLPLSIIYIAPMRAFPLVLLPLSIIYIAPMRAFPLVLLPLSIIYILLSPYTFVLVSVGHSRRAYILLHCRLIAFNICFVSVPCVCTWHHLMHSELGIPQEFWWNPTFHVRNKFGDQVQIGDPPPAKTFVDMFGVPTDSLTPKSKATAWHESGALKTGVRGFCDAPAAQALFC